MTHNGIKHEELPEFPKLLTNALSLTPEESAHLIDLVQDEGLNGNEFDLWREADGTCTVCFRGQEAVL